MENIDQVAYEFMTLERELAIERERSKELLVQNIIMQSMLKSMGVEVEGR